jgi:uncharacterized protein
MNRHDCVLKLLAATVLLCSSAFALDMDAQSPAIAIVKARRSERATLMTQWKDAGAIGESAAGTVEVLPQARLSLSQRKEVRDLCLAENEDRRALFRELVFANVLSEAELPAIAGAFAKQQRNAAEPAHWVEDPAKSQWIQKKDLR